MLEEDMAILPDVLQLCAEKGIQLCVSDDAGAEIEKLRSSMPQLAENLMAKLQSFFLLTIRHATSYGDGDHYNVGALYGWMEPYHTSHVLFRCIVLSVKAPMVTGLNNRPLRLDL